MMNSNKTILIAGYSGLIGTQLLKEMQNTGVSVRFLTRSSAQAEKMGYFKWSPNNLEIDARCMEGVTHIINLTGYSISNSWSQSNKRKMYDSRVLSTRLLYTAAKQSKTRIKAIINASAIGYYGFNSQGVQYEEMPPGNDWLAKLCIDWENEVKAFTEISDRVITLRFSPVVHSSVPWVGLLTRLFKIGLGAAIGSLSSPMPWVHLEDASGFVRYALDNDEISGVYNVTAPKNSTQGSFMNALSRQTIGRDLILPNIPTKLIMPLIGEKVKLLVSAPAVSFSRVLNTGYRFKFLDEKETISNLLNH